MSLGNFFGGLSQGFGSTLFQGQQAQLEKKEREKMLTYQGLQGLFNKAADEGDNKAAADIYEHMGAVIGDKKMHLFVANILRNTQPQTVKEVTPEAQAAQTNINQLQTNQQSNSSNTSNTLVGVPPSPGYDRQNMNQPAGGIVKNIEAPTTNNKPTIEYNPLLDAERPRKAIGERITQQGFFATPEEKQQRALGAKVAEHRALLPIEVEEEAAKQKAIGERMEKVAGIQASARERLRLSMRQDAINKPFDQDLQDYKAANPGIDETTARQVVGQMRVDKRNAQLEDIRSRKTNREAEHQLRVRDIDAKINHWNQLEQQGRDKIAQGDKRIGLQYGGGRASQERLKTYRAEMNSIVIQQDMAYKTMTNPLSSDDDKERARQLFSQLNIEYDKRQKFAEDEASKLDSVISTIETNTPAKIIGKKKSIDPLGIR